jgi:PhnB protein
MKIIPSFTFDGNAEEAMNFYKDALGGEITGTMRYRDMPGSEASPDSANKVVHGELKFNDSSMYFNDFFFEGGVTSGNRLEINLDCDSAEQLKMFYDGLKTGALNITMEPQDTFWGAYYAQLTDKYGVGWSFNFQKETLNFGDK